MSDFFAHYLPLSIVTVIFTIGIISSFFPILPACIIICSGIILHKLWVPEFSVSWTFVTFSVFLTLFAQILDLVCTYWGARTFGATWRGGLGALVGAIAGPLLFAPLLGVGIFIGLIIGPVIGAILGEYITGRPLRHAGRAGVGTIVGGLAAFAAKVAIACTMIAGFFFYMP